MDGIRREDANWEYRSKLVRAHESMIVSRTMLELGLKAQNRRINTAVKRNFFYSFRLFYGLVLPKLNYDEHLTLINDISAWNKVVTIGQMSDGLEYGIELSEQLQRAVSSDGILGK